MVPEHVFTCVHTGPADVASIPRVAPHHLHADVATKLERREEEKNRSYQVAMRIFIGCAIAGIVVFVGAISSEGLVGTVASLYIGVAAIFLLVSSSLVGSTIPIDDFDLNTFMGTHPWVRRAWSVILVMLFATHSIKAPHALDATAALGWVVWATWYELKQANDVVALRLRLPPLWTSVMTVNFFGADLLGVVSVRANVALCLYHQEDNPALAPANSSLKVGHHRSNDSSRSSSSSDVLFGNTTTTPTAEVMAACSDGYGGDDRRQVLMLLTPAIVLLLGATVLLAVWSWQQRRFRQTGGLKGASATEGFYQSMYLYWLTLGVHNIIKGLWRVAGFGLADGPPYLLAGLIESLPAMVVATFGRDRVFRLIVARRTRADESSRFTKTGPLRQLQGPAVHPMAGDTHSATNSLPICTNPLTESS